MSNSVYKLDSVDKLKNNWEVIDVKINKEKGHRSEWKMIVDKGNKLKTFQVKQITDIRNSVYFDAYSILLFKPFQYYDFELKVNVMLASTESFSIILRAKDKFNYYKLVIDNNNTSKKLYKVIGGKSNEISTARDNCGITNNVWTRLLIRAKGDIIEILIGTEYKNVSGEEPPMEEIIKIEDSEFKSGKVGFISTGKNFSFSNLVITALPCITEWELREEIRANPPMTATANYYKEKFQHSINTKYEFPNSNINNYDNYSFRENVLDSQSVIYFKRSNGGDMKKNPERIPVLAILKNKILKNGEYVVDLMLSHSGTISLIFNYIDKSNFYAFEIGRENGSIKENFFQLRKIKDEKPEIIKKINYIDANNIIPFQTNNFYRVNISIIVDLIKIKIKSKGKFTDKAKTNDSYRLVLEEKFPNNKLEPSGVGLGGLDTNMVFSRIEVRPPKERTTKIVTFSDTIDLPHDKFILFGYDNVDKKVAEDKKAKKDDKTKLYAVCLEKQTEESVINYCKHKFNIEIIRKRCEVRIL